MQNDIKLNQILEYITDKDPSFNSEAYTIVNGMIDEYIESAKYVAEIVDYPGITDWLLAKSVNNEREDDSDVLTIQIFLKLEIKKILGVISDIEEEIYQYKVEINENVEDIPLLDHESTETFQDEIIYNDEDDLNEDDINEDVTQDAEYFRDIEHYNKLKKDEIKNYKKKLRFYNKIYNHIDLEVNRTKVNIDQLKSIESALNSQMDISNIMIQQNIDEVVKDSYNQNITLLSIFSAIIFGLFGGISFVSNIASNITKINSITNVYVSVISLIIFILGAADLMSIVYVFVKKIKAKTEVEKSLSYGFWVFILSLNIILIAIVLVAANTIFTK